VEGGRGRVGLGGEDQLEVEGERERLIGERGGGGATSTLGMGGGIIGGLGGLFGGFLGRNKDGSRDIRDGREVKDFEKVNKKI